MELIKPLSWEKVKKYLGEEVIQVKKSGASMRNKAIPKFVAPCLWSCNINKLDLQKDKQMIITQVLNYGDEKRVRWLYSVYSEKDIKNVVSHPKRGLWFDKVLNFWERILNIRIQKKIRQKAIFDINPIFSKRM